MGDAFLTIDQNSYISFYSAYMLMLSTVKMGVCSTLII